MANHRAQAQFERAKWSLRLLLPLWALQLMLATATMGLFSWRLGGTAGHYQERRERGSRPAVELAWEMANVVLSFVAAVCTLFEMARLVAEALTPWTMLFTHVLKLTCASAILALDIVVYVLRSDAHYSLVGLGLDTAMIITAVASAIYAILTYRRLSAYDDYARAANVKGYGFSDGLDADFSYAGRYSLRASLDQRRSVSSPSPAAAA
ncbi:hypothetical protein CDD83_10911 [Cordyceps sp. RAO-2017]|nr:hypothetical protein CDD83_10911 [Cordyceps sp. RAO-2017]